MSKVVTENELATAKNEIIEGIKCLNDEINLLNGYIEKLPENLSSLEGALQTTGGSSISSDMSATIEEIQNALNILIREAADTDCATSINWNKKVHRVKKSEFIM